MWENWKMYSPCKSCQYGFHICGKEAWFSGGTNPTNSWRWSKVCIGVFRSVWICFRRYRRMRLSLFLLTYGSWKRWLVCCGYQSSDSIHTHKFHSCNIKRVLPFLDHDHKKKQPLQLIKSIKFQTSRGTSMHNMKTSFWILRKIVVSKYNWKANFFLNL